MPLCLCLLLIDQSKPLPIPFLFHALQGRGAQSAPNFFLEGGGLGRWVHRGLIKLEENICPLVWFQKRKFSDQPHLSVAAK